jgi:tight adherence protein C
MYKGQPFQLSQVLPGWIKVDEFYIGLASAAALLCGYAIYSTFKQRDNLVGRIKSIQERRRELRGEVVTPRKRRRPETSVNFMRSVANKLQLVKKLQVGKAESTLIEAGYRSKDAISIMAFFVMALPIILGLLGIIIMQINIDTPSKWHMFHYIWPVLGAYIGLKLPWMYVSRQRKKRYNAIQKSLSDVLDLMTICAEAGLSLAAMLDRVSRELSLSYPEMAEELGMTSIEIGFLPDRNKALSNLAERCRLSEVRGIVSVLIQTEKYGTPIAQALRVLSAEFRQARMLRAEQKAARLPALMTIPMIVFILPTLFIVIIAPAVVKLMDTLGSQ